MRNGVVKRDLSTLDRAVEAAIGALTPAERNILDSRIMLAKRRARQVLEPFDSEVCGIQVTVTPDGEIFAYPTCTNSVKLDEIRLAAASHYLDQKRGLSMSQYRYWSAVSQTTVLKNFTDREKGRRQR